MLFYNRFISKTLLTFLFVTVFDFWMMFFKNDWYSLIFKISIKLWMNLIQTYNLFSKNLNYLYYKSCQPTHTKNNIALSLSLPDALRELLLITKIIDFKNLKITYVKIPTKINWLLFHKFISTLGNMKEMTKMLLPSLEFTSLIIKFFPTNLKITLTILQVEKFKKHLMTKTLSLTHDQRN